MIQLFQFHKGVIYNFFEGVQVLLLFQIFANEKGFIKRNKVESMFFVLLYFMNSLLADYLPVGLKSIFYMIVIMLLIRITTGTNLALGLVLMTAITAFFLITEAMVFLPLSSFNLDGSKLDDKRFLILGSTLINIIRFVIIYLAHNSKIDIAFLNIKERFKDNLVVIALYSYIPIFIELLFIIIVLRSNDLGMYANVISVILIQGAVISYAIISVKRKNMKLINELDYKEQMATVSERNRILREVHDSLGHTLTVLTSLIKLSKIELKTNVHEAEDMLNQAIEVANKGLNELRSSISGDFTEKLAETRMTIELEKLIEESRMTGIKIDFSVLGEERQNNGVYSDVLYRICQEAITNSIRHGKASKIVIILKFLYCSIQLFIVDDGVGCLYVKKGYGLRGMEERIQSLDGKISYGTSGDKGFSIYTEIPLKECESA